MVEAAWLERRLDGNAFVGSRAGGRSIRAGDRSRGGFWCRVLAAGASVGGLLELPGQGSDGQHRRAEHAGSLGVGASPTVRVTKRSPGRPIDGNQSSIWPTRPKLVMTPT